MPDAREGGFRYTHHGTVFPSVTTILSAAEPKPWMKSWASRETARWAVENQAAWRDLDPEDAIKLIKGGPEKTRTRASDLGTAIHLVAEAHANGEAEPAVPEGVRPLVKQFLSFIRDFAPEPIMTEERVFNRRVGFAGTFDLLANCPLIGERAPKPHWGGPAGHGPRVLLDYKSGKGVYASVALQLRAYAEGEFVQKRDGTEMPMFERPDAYYAIHLRPRGYALVRVNADHPEVWRAFRAMAAIRTWVENFEPLVLERV